MEYEYLLKCSDNTIYTGHTQNLKERLKRLNKGENTYTKYRLIGGQTIRESFCKKAFVLKTKFNYNSFCRWFFLCCQFVVGIWGVHTIDFAELWDIQIPEPLDGTEIK